MSSENLNDFFAVAVSDNPARSIIELGERIRDGAAFIVGYTGASCEELRDLECEALEGLKRRKVKPRNLKLHIVQKGGVVFEVLE